MTSDAAVIHRLFHAVPALHVFSLCVLYADASAQPFPREFVYVSFCPRKPTETGPRARPVDQ